MRIIAVVNQKGGTGKTTTAVNLSCVMARRGQRTLLVDTDPQGHGALALAVPPSRIDLQLGDVIGERPDRTIDRARLLWAINRRLDLLPSTARLASVEAPGGPLGSRPDRDSALADLLARFEGEYDWCFIDCSPSIGLLTFNALRAAGEVLVPVETGYFAMQGAISQIATIASVSRRLGRPLPYRLLATMHDPASVVSLDVLSALNERFPRELIPVEIRYDAAVKQSAAVGLGVCDYAPQSPAALDYDTLATWLALHAPDGTMPVTLPPPNPMEQAAFERASIERAGGPDTSLGGRLGSLLAPLGVADGPEAHANGHVNSNGNGNGNGHGSGNGHPAEVEHVEPGSPRSIASRVAELASRARALSAASDARQAQREADPRVADAMRRIDAGDNGASSAATLAPAPAPVVTESPAEAPRLRSRPVAPAPPTEAPAKVPAPVPPQPAETVQPGVENTASGLRFVFVARPGQRVHVAGSFNGWSSDAHELRPLPAQPDPARVLMGVTVEVAPARVAYRYVVDGKWIPDPANQLTEPNEYGQLNSVVYSEGS
ncbi:MAG: AAA family ATPase [Planctomycetota bacterium]